MATPAVSWDRVPVFGFYFKGDETTPIVGKVKLSLTERVTRVDGRVIYPEGAVVERTIGDHESEAEIRDAVRDAWKAADELALGEDFVEAEWDAWWAVMLTGAVFASFPASDDPDIVQTGYKVKVEEQLNSGKGKVFFIEPLLAHLANTPPGVNLGLVEVPPGAPSAPAPVYAKGVRGGVAAIDADGDVVDADGNKVSGGLDESAVAAVVATETASLSSTFAAAIAPINTTLATLPATYAHAVYFDAEKYKTGSNTDLQAIHAACAAATAYTNGSATVRLSARVWNVGNGLAMAGYRCGLIGTGSAQQGGNYRGTILHATTQTGPVLELAGFLSPAFGRLTIGNFMLRGDNTADATKVKTGLSNTSLTALGGMNFEDITIAETGGHGVDMRLLYLSTMSRVVVRTPVSAKANDVAYFRFVNCNGTTFNDLGCRSTLSSADTGVSGAIVVTHDELHGGTSMVFNHPWFEHLHVPTGGALIKAATNQSVFRDLYLPDTGKEAGATDTCVLQFLTPAMHNSGGNTLDGVIPGTNSGSWDTGVKVSQSRNRITGPKGFKGGNVTIDSGITNTYVALQGGISGATDSAFTDNSGNTTNTLLDFFNHPGTGRSAISVQGTGTITKIHGPITQAAYDALSAKAADTLYVIVG